MSPATPSFTLAEPQFAFGALAQTAARAPLGGAREGLLATLVAARLAWSFSGPDAISAALRIERAAAAKQWMGALSLTAGLRTDLLRLVEATAGSDPSALCAALDKVTEATALHFDRKARLELGALSRELGG